MHPGSVAPVQLTDGGVVVLADVVVFGHLPVALRVLALVVVGVHVGLAVLAQRGHFVEDEGSAGAAVAGVVGGGDGHGRIVP